MRRLLALGCIAALAFVASAVALWPRDRSSPAAACCNESWSPGAAFPVVSHLPDVAAPARADETHSDTWPAFIGACRRKDFASAKKLAPAVNAAAIEGCADLLALPREFSWQEADARALRAVAAAVFSGHDEPGTENIRYTSLLEYERCWPAKGALDAARQSRVAGEVDAKPLDVPERAALLPGDWLFVDTIRLGGTSPAAELRALLETAAKAEQSERPRYEPLLSALIHLLAGDAKHEAQQVAREYVAKPNLSARLRWELQVLALTDGVHLAAFLKAIEPKQSKIDAALREALKAGLTVEELLRIVIPYLESRFGGGEASHALFGPVASWIRNALAEQFEIFVSGASACFLEAAPGSGLAGIYVKLLNLGCSRRDIEQAGRALIEDLPEGARIKSVLPSERAAPLREAIVKHRERSLEWVKETELPAVSLAELCVLLVETSRNLSEAISELEQQLRGKRDIESDGLKQGFATVLMRCRAMFADELNNDWILRERLVRLAELVLTEPRNGPRNFDSLWGSTDVCSLVVFADQLLAICGIPPQTALADPALFAIGQICERFRATCYEKGTNPPAVKPGYRRFVETFKRVEERMKDPKINPRAR